MDILEDIAAALHLGWLQYQDSIGVRFSPYRDRGKKQHPHFVPWSALDTEAMNQDRFQATVLLLRWKNKELTESNLPEQIHEAWRVWEQLSRGIKGKPPHDHDGPYHDKHPVDPGEHLFQAKAVWEVLTAENRR
jgi:hypothetical protein